MNSCLSYGKRTLFMTPSELILENEFLSHCMENLFLQIFLFLKSNPSKISNEVLVKIRTSLVILNSF